QPLYRHVAALVDRLGAPLVGQCGYSGVGAVVWGKNVDLGGGRIIEKKSTWFLVPGFGAQGGTAADVAAAFDARGLGGIVNNSRGIIFAHRREEYAQRFGAARWQEAVEAATQAMIDQLRDVARA
ncbi:MAG: orotidine 5'-phosphate decarboxylase, partial [Planctomycetales bacterium]|nr:orotidine 5'-phosphate decarboxylase [Planctomycetales bacterium]